jgi:heme/copper-type cytochrome/quinol oxidase subunit 2
MSILQITQQEVSSTINSTILQYGILGIVALALAYFSWSQYKRLIDRNDALEIKVDKLQNEMFKLLVEERDRMSKLISDNTQALSDLQKVITEYIIKSK